MATSSTNDYDTVVAAIEGECQQKWLKLQDINTRLQETRITQPANPDDKDLSGIYKAKEKVLKAQLKLLENSDITFPTEKVVHQELLLEELTQSVKQLEETKALSHTLYTEAEAELAKETQLNEQYSRIKSALQEKIAQAPEALENEQRDDALIRESTDRLQFLQKYSHTLLEQMARFMNEKFPPPNREQTLQWLRKSGHVEGDNEDMVLEFHSLQAILEDLMNRCMDTPHDPYIQLDPMLHWQPYIQLLTRCGIALRHPQDDTKLKLTPFHL